MLGIVGGEIGGPFLGRGLSWIGGRLSGEVAFNSNIIGGASKLFGRARLGSFGREANRLLNRGYFRIGWSWDAAMEQHVFQPRIGPTYGAIHFAPWIIYIP